MARTLFFFIYFGLLTFFYGTMAMIFGRAFGDRAGNFAQRTWARRSLAVAGAKIQADFSALDPNQTYIFMVNHQSNFDIPILTAALRHWTVRMVAKESLFKIPVFGWAISRIGHISVDRGNRRQAMQAIQNAVDMANSGVSMVIFPEGTRSTDFSRLHEFKTGGFILALKCGQPVAPLVMSGSGELMPKGRMVITPGTIKIKALPPVDPGRYSLKEREKFKDDLQQAMHQAYLEIHNGG